ncbi:MAG: site-2 protease family protein [Planctomycetota bacterium]|nr:site-2 protease family protein [Planctomycetota bacterium]
MSRGFLIGRLFGTDIYLSLGHVLLLTFFFLSGRDDPAAAAMWCLTIVVSILVHEFGHVFAVKWWLKAESTVILSTLGGLCLHPRTQRPGQQIGISLMGPAFGFLLGALAFVLWQFELPPFAKRLAEFFVWINIVWTALNLLPILPLDGGQAMRALLEMSLPREKAFRVARIMSLVLLAAGGALALALKEPFLILLCGLMFLENLGRRTITYH